MPLDQPGIQSTFPPTRCGGNLDCRELTEGAVLFLPIAVDGGLFSTGDGHAVQGDGEVGPEGLGRGRVLWAGPGAAVAPSVFSFLEPRASAALTFARYAWNIAVRKLVGLHGGVGDKRRLLRCRSARTNLLRSGPSARCPRKTLNACGHCFGALTLRTHSTRLPFCAWGR
jgi:hypothetical protein